MFFAGRNPLTITLREPMNSPTDLQNSATVDFYLKAPPSGPVQIEITDLAGQHRFTGEMPARQGINRYFWNLRFDVDPTAARETPAGAGEEGGFGPGRPRGVEAMAGTYWVRLTVAGKTYEGTVTVREDPAAAEVGR